MIIDAQCMWTMVHATGVMSQAVTGDAASTNVIDHGLGDLGKTRRPPAEFFVQVDEDFNNLTSLTIKLQTDDNSAFSSAVTVAERTVLLADLTAGSIVWQSEFPVGCERYTRLYFDVTGTDPTAGKIQAGMVVDHYTWSPFED